MKFAFVSRKQLTSFVITYNLLPISKCNDIEYAMKLTI